jgi:hypothetical protein
LPSVRAATPSTVDLYPIRQEGLALPLPTSSARSVARHRVARVRVHADRDGARRRRIGGALAIAVFGALLSGQGDRCAEFG